MGRIVLRGAQAAQLLSLLAREMDSEVTLSKAIIAMNGNPKKDVAVIFTDSFGNADVKPA